MDFLKSPKIYSPEFPISGVSLLNGKPEIESLWQHYHAIYSAAIYFYYTC